MESFSSGACTWTKILLSLQVWNLFATGEQILRAADCKSFVPKGQHPFGTVSGDAARVGGVSCVFLSIVLRVNLEIALGMVTGGADLRGLLPYHDVAAVAALPHLHLALGKHLRHLHVAQQCPIALLMVLLNGPHQAESLGQLMKPSSSAVLAKPSYMSVHS